jgi:hypothetical protein
MRDQRPNSTRNEIHPMDRRTLRQFRTDVDSPCFQKEYQSARDLWDAGNQKGGLYDATLFDLAMRHQVGQSTAAVEVTIEVDDNIPTTVVTPQTTRPTVKKKVVKKKSLAKA